MGEGEQPPADLDAGDAERFAECITSGGVVLFPADTVYGLACDPLQPQAVRRLYELKGRPPAKPAAVMFFALAPALAALPELGPRTRAALARLLPGPLTALLPNPRDRWPLACRSSSGSAAGTGSAIGLRVPLLPDALAALGALKLAVLQSSANLSGGPEARRLGELVRGLRDGVDLELNGGELPGLASTVLDLREYEQGGVWSVTRAGPVDQVELQRRLGRSARHN